MQTVPVEIENGVLRLPKSYTPPVAGKLAVLLLEPDELTSLAEAGGAFDFLREEPELYSDADLKRPNPQFGQRPK
jgi:hypothetical protein